MASARVLGRPRSGRASGGSLPFLTAARPVAVLAVLMLVAAVLLLHETRGMTFYFDDWDFVLGRRGASLDALLKPHNGHLLLLPVALYKLLFATLGAEPYWPLRVAITALHLGVVALVFAYARRRIGDWLALAMAVLVLFCGAAWEDVLWPINAGFVGSVACAVGMLACLDRRDRRGDIGASALLAGALASSSFGISVALAAATEVLLRGDRRRRAWILVAPVVLYGAWRIGYHAQSPFDKRHLVDIPRYGADLAANTVGGLAGLGIEWGRSLTILTAVVLVLVIVRGAALTPRIAALAVAATSFWAITAIARAGVADPTSSRYVYPGAVVLLLIGAELARDARPPSPRVAWIVGAVVTIAAVGGLAGFRDGGQRLRDQTALVSSELGALELVGRSAAPDFEPDPQIAPQVRAGPYLDAVRDLGSPSDSLARLRRAPPQRAAAADRVVLEALHVRPAPAGRCPAGSATLDAGLEAKLPRGGGLRVSNAGTTPLQLRLSRFAHTPASQPFATLAPRSTVTISIPPDRAPDPWRLRIDGGAATTCPA
jgi:hypothetical protein